MSLKPTGIRRKRSKLFQPSEHKRRPRLEKLSVEVSRPDVVLLPSPWLEIDIEDSGRPTSPKLLEEEDPYNLSIWEIPIHQQIGESSRKPLPDSRRQNLQKAPTILESGKQGEDQEEGARPVRKFAHHRKVPIGLILQNLWEKLGEGQPLNATSIPEILHSKEQENTKEQDTDESKDNSLICDPETIPPSLPSEEVDVLLPISLCELPKQEGMPFQVGQDVEVRSHKKGYRGAWFNCKITRYEIDSFARRSGHSTCLQYWVKYVDYEGEEEERMGLYRRFHPKSGIRRYDLMIRPIPPCQISAEKFAAKSWPPECTEVVVQNDMWRIGDAVDWYCDNCWWTGRIIEIDNHLQQAELELLPKPYGEGKLYTAKWQDMRVSLMWELGQWTAASYKGSRWSSSPSGFVVAVEPPEDSSCCTRDDTSPSMPSPTELLGWGPLLQSIHTQPRTKRRQPRYHEDIPSVNEVTEGGKVWATLPILHQEFSVQNVTPQQRAARKLLWAPPSPTQPNVEEKTCKELIVTPDDFEEQVRLGMALEKHEERWKRSAKATAAAMIIQMNEASR